MAYTDGSCINNGTVEARAGSGVWYGPDDPGNAAIRVPGEKQTNQIAKLLAILHVVKNTHGEKQLKICSDSQSRDSRNALFCTSATLPRGSTKKKVVKKSHSPPHPLPGSCTGNQCPLKSALANAKSLENICSQKLNQGFSPSTMMETLSRWAPGNVFGKTKTRTMKRGD